MTQARQRAFGRGYGVQRKPNPNRWAYDAAYEEERRAMLATATHCAICGEPPYPGNPLTADHVIPITMDGAGGPSSRLTRSATPSRERHWQGSA
jgi:hypothetical protein